MTRDLFRRYVWLIDVVSHANKLTFDQISRLWSESTLNSNSSRMVLRTFHNHRDAINQLFGIKIDCDRGDNKYYINDNDDTAKIKSWMLQTLILFSQQKDGVQNADRVIFDFPTGNKLDFFNLIIEAIRDNKIMRLAYLDLHDNTRRETGFEPYCVRLFKNCWYVMGKETGHTSLKVFDLSMIISATLTSESFRLPTGFSAKSFFNNFYGMEIESNPEPVEINIKAYSPSRDTIRAVPIHPTQKELDSCEQYSLFSLDVVTTKDLKMCLLSFGADIEVIKPLKLREEIAEITRHMVSRYQ